ncbi:MAG TPA: GNAT family N-acetyltransferase [Burkholderiaceae bacterium]
MPGEAAVSLRPYQVRDAPRLKQIVTLAWCQFAPHFSDWPAFEMRLLQIERLAAQVELIVAEVEGVPAGFVGYAGRGAPKADFFEPGWAAIRMLSVDPAMRGRGIGRALIAACLVRARNEGAAVVALHTSPIMVQAERMYLKLGFARVRALPELDGVSYYLYTKTQAA